MQKSEVHKGRQLQGADFAAEFQAHAADVGSRRVFPVRDVQEQEDRRQGRREAGGDAVAAAAMRTLQNQQTEGRFPSRAVGGTQQARSHSQVLRLLAPAVHGAELPDVQGLQEPGVHEGSELQRADFGAEFEAHAADVGGRRVFPVREVPEAAVFALRRVEDESGLFDGAAEAQK